MNIENLVEKYSRLVYKICFDMLADSLDAEDAVQDVYINIYKVRERYRDLTENELKNVICKAALNRCRDILKSKAKKLESMISEDEDVLEKTIYDNDIEKKIIMDEQKQYIQKAIQSLGNPYSKILKLYFIDEFSLDEVSSTLNIPKATLKVQLYRAKQKLKDILIIDKGGGHL